MNTNYQTQKNKDSLAVLLTTYGGVNNYQQFNEYNRRASQYIAAKFAPIPKWLYPVAARILTLRDLYKWGSQHDHFISPQNKIFENQKLGIEENLRKKWGESIQVFTAFYFCEPFVKQALIEIKNQGFNRLLVYPLLVVDSVFTSSIAVEQINQTLDELGKKKWPEYLRYIPSFCDRLAYIDLIVHQIKETIRQDIAEKFVPSRIGLVLETHGGPEKTQGLVTGVKDGQTLYEGVREQLIYQYPLISIGWINHDTPLLKWTEPTLEQAARNLIELGAETIIFKPIGWATENYETILDVEEAIESLRHNCPEINYVQLGCVNDDPRFLTMAAEWANPHIEALLSSS